MMPAFHIPRTLMIGNRTIPEAELLRDPGIAIVLAEPGGGKTALLHNIAAHFATTPVRASLANTALPGPTLVIDAFDEVARQGPSKLTDTLKLMRRPGTNRIVLSSRAGEWEEAQTLLLADLMGTDPVVARLVPLTPDEQTLLLHHDHPDLDVFAFLREIERFDLAPLLGNPEFLRLFAGAFRESGGTFPSRRAIFTLAVENLASETNARVDARHAPSRAQRIAWADAVFARLLLSGSDGLATTDAAASRTFPHLPDLQIPDPGLRAILDTRLFRPGTAPGLHEPVHRIVAEHCAARALVARVDDPTTVFTMRQCLALVAPNGVTRDDLRGLLGWMAALGSQTVQDAAIDTDPYSILSNGDPSLLSPRSRRRLLDALVTLERDDPYFRRSDRWRNFAASGFFTPDIVDVIRPILAAGGTGDLRGLLLELLVGTPALPALRTDLEATFLDPEAGQNIRQMALGCLQSDPAAEVARHLPSLLATGDQEALYLAADILRHLGTETVPMMDLLSFLRAAAALYPTARRPRENVIGGRYFLRRLIQTFDPALAAKLLDALTDGLACTCGADGYRCTCRIGISKVAGLLLDRYFGSARSPHDPDRVWGWTHNLNYPGGHGPTDKTAIDALQADDVLRNALQERMFAGLTTGEDFRAAGIIYRRPYGHSGLNFVKDDHRHMVDHAFKAGNVELWAYFARAHDYYGKTGKRDSDPLRRHCREQVRENMDFLPAWSAMNRARALHWREDRFRPSRSMLKWGRRERKAAAENRRFLIKNKDIVESGAHFNWLDHLASFYLMDPQKLPEVTQGLIDPDKVLRNGLRTCADQCPPIKECQQPSHRNVLMILHAGCVAEFRATGSLDAIDTQILRAIFMETFVLNDAVTDDERESLEAEILKRTFLTDDDREHFARNYIEPALASSDGWPDVWLLDNKPAFNHLRGTLPLEWLHRFPDLRLETIKTLFDMAARDGNRHDLLNLLHDRCIALDKGFLPHRNEDQRQFWFLRHFWFTGHFDAGIWSSLCRDPAIVFALERQNDRRRDESDGWPALGATKIEAVLNDLLPHWPEVDLPSSWGSDSPRGETAFRYLSDLVWQVGRDTPEAALPVLHRLIADPGFVSFHPRLRTIRADIRRQRVLSTFKPPSLSDVAVAVDRSIPATVEQLRALVVELFAVFQSELRGSDLDILGQFYDGGFRVDEPTATLRIAAWFRHRLTALGIGYVVEHHLAKDKRCDFTISRLIDGRRIMVVIEVKGQWNKALFTAVQDQLMGFYAIHEDADGQGIYLVLWFGDDQPVAGLKTTGVTKPDVLYTQLTNNAGEIGNGKIDAIVLDFQRQGSTTSQL